MGGGAKGMNTETVNEMLTFFQAPLAFNTHSNNFSIGQSTSESTLLI